MNSQFRAQTGTFIGTYRESDRENLECNEDRSQNNPHAEMNSTVKSSPNTVISDPDAVIHNSPLQYLQQNVVRGAAPLRCFANTLTKENEEIGNFSHNLY